ncbi:STAS domain-containing protein [Streptomyces aureus]
MGNAVKPQDPHLPQRMTVTSANSGDVVVLTVSGEIDQATVRPLVDGLDLGPLAGRPQVVVDLERVSFMDSSGINTLLTAHRGFTRAQGWLRLAGVPASVHRTLRAVGVDEVIPSYATLHEALAV